MNFEQFLLALFAVYAHTATGGAKDFANKALGIVAAAEAATAPVPPAA
jgi:hypothetical protein